jgi:hypothetical protein
MINNELKGFARKQSWSNQDSIPEFSSRDWKKIMRSLNQDSPFPERDSESRAYFFNYLNPFDAPHQTLPTTHAKSEATTTFKC